MFLDDFQGLKTVRRYLDKICSYRSSENRLESEERHYKKPENLRMAENRIFCNEKGLRKRTVLELYHNHDELKRENLIQLLDQDFTYSESALTRSTYMLETAGILESRYESSEKVYSLTELGYELVDENWGKLHGKLEPEE